jgi:asparagine synthetase B (glutamine-hydrolysing)
MKRQAIATIAAVMLTLPALAGNKSGLNPGDSITPFHPKHIAGPLAGTDKCFPCTYQARPQVQIWVNGDSADNVAKIAKALEGAMAKYQGNEFKALIVMLSSGNDTAALNATAKKVAAEAGLKNVAVAILPKTDSAVSAYKVSLDSSVKSTLFVYRDWKVAKTFVNLKGDAKGLGELNAAVASISK